MLFSMTGFGKGMAAAPGLGQFTVEISSVNRKQMEVRISAPNELSSCETLLRKKIAQAVSRGSLQVKVSWLPEKTAVAESSVNTALLDALIAAALAARDRAGLTDNVRVEELFLVPGVVRNETAALDSPECAAALEQACDEALNAFQAMRKTEGAALAADFTGRLHLLKELLAKIEPAVAGIPAAAKKRLLKKLAADDLPVNPADERLLREVLYYADKADVTEEITRIKSHFVQFEKFLQATEPIGRSLDFLMQELFREITTLSNKAGIPAISPLTVAFKSELEKLREQIQNVE